MKILVLGEMLKERHKEQISNIAQRYGAQVCFAGAEKEVPVEFAEPEVIYGFGMQIAKTQKSLKWLCVPSAGVDYLMKPGVFANEECLLSNSSGAYGVSISEHMIATSLMMMRRLTEFCEETKAGQWGRPRPQRSLWGSRITVLGTGDIGQCFAKRAKAFDPARITGVNRSGKCPEAVFDKVVDGSCQGSVFDKVVSESGSCQGSVFDKVVSVSGSCQGSAFDKVVSVGALDEVLPETDLLAMSLPDTPETRGILTRERLWSLPEGAFIVNVGRGSAIDEEALADCLEARHLAGAALDVFQKEPLPAESRLWKTPGMLITPHVAGNLTLEYTLDKNVSMFCEDLVNYAEGRALKYAVDRKKGY